ncbi:site-specific integrase [Hymenobacter fodinae]|uniref:Site-specific integrase n=1 Tax=Hymenobacter fodinae TaxID=2510796 RepID=A0A4Z0PBD6_9BACT|nr:site-specific integrase [Hymenobacter fodinae]TGE09946.1 site-specific integrase [Hymenobacter fodinae]
MSTRTTEHKEGKATVKVVYYTSKTLADGAHPFVVRITKNRKQVYRYTGLSLLPKYWNADKKEIRRSYPEPKREELLKELEKWRKKYEAAADILAENDEEHDAKAVFKKAVEGRKAQRRVKLLAFIEELATSMITTGQVGNAGVYRDLGNQLAKFIGAESNAPEPPIGKGLIAAKAAWIKQYDVPLDHITVAFCNEWEATLRATGITEITLSLRFRTLRTVFNKAIAAGLVKASNYPFTANAAERHKFQVGKFDVTTAKRAISREELRKLEALEPVNDRQKLAKDVFLFSFYCGGINFVDLAQLRWRNLEGVNEQGYPVRLNYKRQKTGGKFSLPLLNPAALMLTSYKRFTFSSPDSYIFPILDLQKHQNPDQVKNRLHKVLGQVNKDLKELGKQAGIAAPLTTYVARHSFATTLKMRGENTAVISQAMGHKSESVTAVYLDSFASDVVDAAFKGLL